MDIMIVTPKEHIQAIQMQGFMKSLISEPFAQQLGLVWFDHAEI